MSKTDTSGTNDMTSAFAFADATPIYVKLVMLFRGNIESGIWPVGENIPPLQTLADDLGVSRATVRQAMSFLEEEGIIQGVRGRGTMVLAKPKGRLWLPVADNWPDMVLQSEQVEAEWAEIEKPLWEPDLSDFTDGKLVDAYHVLRRVLSQNGVPYLVGTSYIDQRIAEAVGAEAFAKQPLFDILDPYLAHIDQSVRIDAADAETAYLIDIPLNAPTVVVRRAGLNAQGEIVYQGEGILRGDFVRVERDLA
ncbi:MAG: GntR family transcriptional regulator [Maritimibacter sp.]|uniref:GntR family transcriptional regulator n=1 Tax=Maritimibacter sp. TaxID=2003363 RepID=UPI001DC28C9F|nr:GntR family transcriptional regulator [Maritimibacter sp.]MBL6426778.1 GntR family transcriptional regulator [Maritimibacter sp.]